MSLVLASASPRRRDLLEALGVAFEVVPSSFDEESIRDLPPVRQARVGALAKAREVASRRPGDWVLASDTVVAVDGQTMGKPRDGVEASLMLRRLSGREHTVVSAVALVAPDGRAAEGHAVSRVAFRDLQPSEITEYVAGGEPFDKAGAYGIQGAAGEFAGLVSGRYDTVVGLPAHTVRRLARSLGGPSSLTGSKPAVC